MADESISKRERQKARRDAKVAAQRAAQAKAKRNRTIALFAAGAVVAGLAGWGVQRNFAQRAEVAAREEAVAARLADLGCTPIEQLADQGAGHIQPLTPEVLAANAPDILYPDRPTSSGQHVGQVVATGVFDNRIDERLSTHNLEHGYVNYFYSADAPEDEVGALKTWAQERIDGDFPKIVVAPYVDGALPDGKQFASLSWNRRQMCDTFDAEVAQVMLDNHYGARSDAPVQERSLPASRQGDQGVLDATDEDVLFPPVSDDASALDAADEAGSTLDDASAEPSVDASADATPEASAEPSAEPGAEATLEEPSQTPTPTSS